MELPVARVVRDGERKMDASADAPAHVLRLAPRKLPRRLVWKLLFGTPLARFGWLFAGFGMVFNLLFLPNAQILPGSYDRTTRGDVLRVEETNSSENDRPIYRLHFVFTDESGREHTGTSYTKTEMPPGRYEIEYDASDPSEARVVGTRPHRFAFWVAFVIVFPIVGLAMAIPQYRSGRLAVRLLRHGVETTGKLVGRRETSVSVNDVPVMALTFAYEVDGKTHRAEVRTLKPSVLEDDAREAMLYDPFAPDQATTLDHLPGAPTVTADGTIASKPGLAVHLLVLPVITALLIAATVIVMILR